MAKDSGVSILIVLGVISALIIGLVIWAISIILDMAQSSPTHQNVQAIETQAQIEQLETSDQMVPNMQPSQAEAKADSTQEIEGTEERFVLHENLKDSIYQPASTVDPFAQLAKIPLDELHRGDLNKTRLDYLIYLYSHTHKTIDPVIYFKGVGFAPKGQKLDTSYLLALPQTVKPADEYAKNPPPNAFGIGFVEYFLNRVKDKTRVKPQKSTQPKKPEFYTYLEILDMWLDDLYKYIERLRKEHTETSLYCKEYFEYVEKSWSKYEVSEKYIQWFKKKFKAYSYEKIEELMKVWNLSVMLNTLCEKESSKLEDIRHGVRSLNEVKIVKDAKNLNKGKIKFRLYARSEKVGVNPLEIPAFFDETSQVPNVRLH